VTSQRTISTLAAKTPAVGFHPSRHRGIRHHSCSVTATAPLGYRLKRENTTDAALGSPDAFSSPEDAWNYRQVQLFDISFKCSAAEIKNILNP